VPASGAVRPGGDRVLLADDGVPIVAWLDPPSAPATGAGSVALVTAHGFTVHCRRPGVAAVVAGLRRFGAVVSFDFRGHGRSGGLSTVGDLEVADLAAAVAWARDLGFRRVVTVGWSMGAGVAVRHAALHGGVDAVVAVSGPSRWHYRGTAPMRLLHLGVETAPGRAVLARLFATRVAPEGWDPSPEPPDALAGRVAPTPLLLVHGDADRYFPIEHARWLALAAGPTATLWEVPGFGHAEASVDAPLLDRIGRWAVAAVTGTATGAGGAGTDPPPGSARMPA
jgi:pimeloyl-ACP methyl ester carboxylesterase